MGDAWARYTGKNAERAEEASVHTIGEVTGLLEEEVPEAEMRSVADPTTAVGAPPTRGIRRVDAGSLQIGATTDERISNRIVGNVFVPGVTDGQEAKMTVTVLLVATPTAGLQRVLGMTAATRTTEKPTNRNGGGGNVDDELMGDTVSLAQKHVAQATRGTTTKVVVGGSET